MSKESPLRILIDLIKHKGNLTQEEIAAKAGYERTYLSQALSMAEPPEKLMTRLKLTFSDILEHQGKDVPPKKRGRNGQENGLKNDLVESLKDQVALLKEKNAILQKNLDLSLGEMRHNILLARALAATNQELLIDLVSRQRKIDRDAVVEDANKLFAEFYKKMKEEGIFAYVGK